MRRERVERDSDRRERKREKASEVRGRRERGKRG